MSAESIPPVLPIAEVLSSRSSFVWWPQQRPVSRETWTRGKPRGWSCRNCYSPQLTGRSENPRERQRHLPSNSVKHLLPRVLPRHSLGTAPSLSNFVRFTKTVLTRKRLLSRRLIVSRGSPSVYRLKVLLPTLKLQPSVRAMKQVPL